MSTREEVQKVQDYMSGLNEAPPLIPTAHHFANGVYARETYLPSGSIVVGKIHRYETINFITLGQVIAVNPEQPEMNKLMVAPFTFESPAGSKRLVMALQDSIWITVHPAESKDLGQLEEELIVTSYDELTLEEKACLGAL